MTYVGLTLGKFAPLHKGHEHVIRTALAEMDQVVVLIYDAPDQTRIPLRVRADWIQRLFPEVDVIQGVAGPTVSGRSLEVIRTQEEYVRRMLGDRKVSHFYSSEFYGEHISRALGAVDRRVDEERTNVPISATRIRQNPFDHRSFVHPIVYRDLVINVALLGAPSTGKTTLASSLADRHNTLWMAEYGREYWEVNQIERRLTSPQLVEIAEGHIRREDALLLESNRYLFSDTNALTTAIFAQYYHGHVVPELARFAHSCSSRYDVFLLCDTDIPYEDTWDRSGEVNRQTMQQMIIEDLNKRGLEFHLVSGDISKRLDQVDAILSGTWKLRP